MTKFVVEMWMDGYNTQKEVDEACEELIGEMDGTATSVNIIDIEEKLNGMKRDESAVMYNSKEEMDLERAKISSYNDAIDDIIDYFKKEG